MAIITPEFEELFENYPLYSQENVKDPIVNAVLYI
jgi:trehalose utilization protein